MHRHEYLSAPQKERNERVLTDRHRLQATRRATRGGLDAPSWRHVLTGLPRVWILCVTLSHLFLVSVFPIPVSAQGAPTETPAQQTLNPLAHSSQLKVTPSLDFSAGPHLDTLMLEFQPRVPIGLTEDWRVVTRSNLSISQILGNEETTGLGDFDASFFLSPARATKWVWGAGPIIQLPTATNMTEGSGKWSTGPTLALVYVNGPWVNGVVASHLWSVAGPSRRESVEWTQIEMQISYTFSNNWYVETNPTISHDWRAPSGQDWFIPIGAVVGREFTIRSQEVSLQVGAYYNGKRPNGTAAWMLVTGF